MRRRRYATLPTEDMLEKITKMMNRMTTLRKIEELHSPRTPVTARLMKQSLMSADGKTADTTTTSRKSTRKTGTATTTDMCDLKKKFNWMHRQIPTSLWFTMRHTRLGPHHRWNRTRQCMTAPLEPSEDNRPRPACIKNPYGLDGL
mmetsp:Transcript_18651/g.44171  ORF Transcript_18651/g.44171 Transcript_18651/m.44171 type:complete len:146 (+) Transcript_18651:302-739(+)